MLWLVPSAEFCPRKLGRRNSSNTIFSNTIFSNTYAIPLIHTYSRFLHDCNLTVYIWIASTFLSCFNIIFIKQMKSLISIYVTSRYNLNNRIQMRIRSSLSSYTCTSAKSTFRCTRSLIVTSLGSSSTVQLFPRSISIYAVNVVIKL